MSLQCESQLILENLWVRVDRRFVAPGQPLYSHEGALPSLVVFVRGGIARDTQSARSVLWRDGRVRWHSSANPSERWINAGPDAMHLVVVELRQAAGECSGGLPAVPLNYPNVPGEDLFENEFVITQRFCVPAHTWEGVHGHGNSTLYVHIRGGQWAVRSSSEPEHVYADRSVDGEVAWMTPIPLDAGHESGNAGDEPIDIVWVSLK